MFLFRLYFLIFAYISLLFLLAPLNSLAEDWYPSKWGKDDTLGSVNEITPEIITNDPTGLEYVIVGEIVNLDAEVIDRDIVDGIDAWLDIDIEEDSDGDGNYENDKDRYLSNEPEIKWDLNIAKDGIDNDGNTMNDFVWGEQVWSLPEYQPLIILLETCDGVNVCSSKQFEITVLGIEEDDGPLSIFWTKTTEVLRC